MSNSKKDLEIVMSLFSTFISGLSNDEYDDLINGYAEIKLISKALKKEQDYLEIIYDLNNQTSIENKITYLNNYMSTKKDLINLCKYLNIETITKDTVAILMEKIIVGAKREEQNIIYKVEKIDNKQNELLSIITFLEETTDSEKAVRFLKEKELSKSDYLNLARNMDVFPEKSANVEVIINMIVKNVVEAKLRSLKIRNKM